ncbi:MAG: DUF2330 domain-containing protein [Candidatus Eisenbacteria bacterium]
MEDDGVVVHDERTVGALLATVVSSDDPGALTQWLRDNGFGITPVQESGSHLLVEAGWPSLLAMKLDTTRVEMPAGGWDTTVAIRSLHLRRGPSGWRRWASSGSTAAAGSRCCSTWWTITARRLRI